MTVNEGKKKVVPGLSAKIISGPNELPTAPYSEELIVVASRSHVADKIESGTVLPGPDRT